MNEHAMHHQREPLGYPDAAEVAMSAAPKQSKPEADAPRTALGVGEEIPDGAGGRFIIRGLIGKGGMGEVYRAAWWKRGVKKSEIVAIKVMVARNADDPKALMRFNFEGEALKDIRHPNVVPVLATGARDDGLAWMAMPLLRGKTLAEILEQQGKLPMPWSLVIIREVCRGLGAVHSIAIHRDIKPPNLFLCIDGVVRILDLGASKFLNQGMVMTTTGFQVGTLPYMSPEQIRNQVLDERSDLFSLTVVLYQMLTGRYPFDFGSGVPGWFETCSRIIDKPHVPPDQVAPWLPRYIVAILNKGLEKEPSKRFRDAAELRDVLTAALNQLAADLGQIEPLTTLAAMLAPREEAPSSPAPMPRTTVPMSPPADARSHGERDAGPNDDAHAPPPRAATPLPYAVTDKVPEVPSEAEHDGFSTWSRPAMLPTEVEVPRVSRIATKRPELGISPPASAPAAEPAQGTSPAASNDVTPEGSEDERPSPSYINLLASIIGELPEELRLPFVWSRVRKRPLDEIAERTGIPAAVVHQRVLVADAAVNAEMERRRPGGHEAPVPAAEKASEPKKLEAPELGPKGTVKMIESAATLLARQGKTLEQARVEAGAGAPPSAARPRSRAIEATIALGAVLLALFGGGVALYLLRARPAPLPLQDVPVTPEPTTTTPIATATTTSAPTTTMPVATATTSATAVPTAAPTATVVPSASATPPTAKRRSGTPAGTPHRRPPRNDAWFRGEDPWKRQGEGPAPASTKKSGPIFRVEE